MNISKALMKKHISSTFFNMVLNEFECYKFKETDKQNRNIIIEYTQPTVSVYKRKSA